ncbi:MAG: hypothetical protein A3E87_02905 [Gammaproteobacteria bacterium RIFCSPHIGHO2_12_FULL_35_23]|nr:MAG: hypothetical protein A3E87_02905 [Gammaproteobacteria bacterium RIFCSPHIGHO2_12_FULL_35_23]
MSKLWAFIVVIVAIVIAVLAILLPQTALKPIFVITTFFDVMIPILAVGALIKYLSCCSKSKSCE